jgi:hypothetical protein
MQLFTKKNLNMKKKGLFILSLLSMALFSKAQVADVTNYRGAFAPAPVRMWTESWVNWDPQNTTYGAPTVNVSGILTGNVTWTPSNVYLLQGIVYVDSNATLTILPGTVIRGDNATANSSLVIQRGAKLIAEGTVCNPIVFTSSKNTGRVPGDWGGIIMLGRARHNLGQQNLIEGLSAANPRNFHGGTDDNDNSGILKYVRIEFGGFVFSANNEINGLTMGSIGRGTQIDYVQVSFTNDDAFEWFGGSVNCKHLVAYRNLDDDFDTDNGYSGTVQYALGIKDPTLADNPTVSTSEGFESDNDAGGTNQALAPKTSASFYNVTQIGAFRCTSNADGSGVQPSAPGFRRGARIRRNSDLKVFNSILMNNWRGLFVDGALALANMDQDSLVFRNNIIAGDFTSTWTAPYSATRSLAAEDANTRSRLTNIDYANDSVNTCSLLTNAWNFLAPDYRPNTGGAGAIVTDPANLSTGADLTPIVEIDGTLFTANQASDFLATILENGGGSTSGPITITIPKPSGWNITVPGLTLTGTNQSGVNGTSNVSGGTANTNGNWNFRDDGSNVIATSKPGVILGKGGFAQIGFIATRRATTSNGTNQSLVVSVAGGSDNSPANNSTVTGLSAN